MVMTKDEMREATLADYQYFKSRTHDAQAAATLCCLVFDKWVEYTDRKKAD